MSQARLVSILYDLTLAVGAELTVRPLLTRVLQRLLTHTALPVGIAVEVRGEEVVLLRSVGDRRLRALEGEPIALEAAWARGPMAELRGAAIDAALERYGFALRLPVAGLGAIVLLGAESYATDLPLTALFAPVLDNLSRAIVLCRANEERTGRLEREREAAQTEAAQSREALAQHMSEKRAIERAFERREKLYRIVIEHSSLAVVLFEPASMFLLEFNDAACNALGYSREELARLGAEALSVNYSPEAVKRIVLQLEREGALELESQQRHKDGSLRDV